MAAHLQALVDSARSGAAADGSRGPGAVGLAVGPRPSAESPALHHAGEHHRRIRLVGKENETNPEELAIPVRGASP